MQHRPLFTLSQVAASAVLAARFIDFDGNHTAADEKPLGVSAYPAETGAPLSVHVLGTVMVESGGAIAKGGPIKPAANGLAIAQGGTGPIVAYALQAATGANQLIEVLLVP